MDPNALNLELDPEFWPNLDQNPDPGLCVFNFVKHYKIQFLGMGIAHW